MAQIVPEAQFGRAVSEFAKFASGVSNNLRNVPASQTFVLPMRPVSAGSLSAHPSNLAQHCLRFVIVAVDTTLWPANSAYVTTALDQLQTVLNMSANNIGHVQCPVTQAQTTTQATLKHKRFLEDLMLARNLDLARTVTLIYKKQESSQRNDRRQMTQSGYAVTSEHTRLGAWISSEVLQTGIINDLPLIKVGDMRGYDPDNKPGAGARVEQILVLGRSFYCIVTAATLDTLELHLYC